MRSDEDTEAALAAGAPVQSSGAAAVTSGAGPVAIASVLALRDLKGRPALHGAWLRIDQPMIDRFADATFDHQWIHVDAARAARESPHRRTIAHGFLSLSLLSHLLGA